MQIIIYIISALLSNFAFSFITAILVTIGFDKMGSDPGSPGIMLVSLLCINGGLSIVIAIIMGIAKAKYQKEFPAKISALIFVITYFPFHINGLLFPDLNLGLLGIPVAILIVILLFLSYIPFFHMTTQGLINLNEFVKKQTLAGNWYVKFIVLAIFGIIIIFAGWSINKPATQPSTGVMSLQEYWQFLETAGQEWQADAYPQRIVFYPNSRLNIEIAVTYFSVNTPQEIYSIDINKYGKITHTQIQAAPSPMRESAKLPIQREDWLIGSDEAWDLFNQIENVNACAKPAEKDAFFSMSLNRIGSGRLAWQLYVGSCSLQNDSHYYLDAYTGERVNSFLD